MKFNKKTLLFSAIALLVLAVIPTIIIYKLVVPAVGSHDEFYKADYINKCFNGNVIKLDRNHGNNHVVDIMIADKTGDTLVYNGVGYSKELLIENFLAEGDHISKNANDDMVTVVKKDGRTKSFVLY